MGRYSGKKCRLMAMFSLTASFFLVEIIVGHVTNSMALIADSFHMLSDIAALVIAFISVKMAPKSWDKNTYGWARAEVLGALVNAVFLVALCFSISIESFKRFYESEEIHDPKMILVVGALGLLVNLLGLCLLHEHGGHGHSHGGHGHSHKRPAHHGTHSHLAALASNGDDHDVPKSVEDARQNGHGHSHNHKTDEKSVKQQSGSQMNMRGVFLHVAADALGSVVVIISALIMWLTDWEYKLYVDPALSLILVCIMMRGVWPLLIESALILLQTVPTHIDIDVLKKKLLEDIDGVLAVHDFHVWQLTGDKIIASAHIRCINLSEYMKVAENIKEFFHKEGIHSTTIQPEFVRIADSDSAGTADEDCVINCPKPNGSIPEPDCDASKCCPTSAANSNGNLKQHTSKSAQNTPITSRRPTSFHEGHEGNSFFNRGRRSGSRNNAGNHRPGGSTSSTGSGGSVRSASYVTSTPNSRQSAPNLSSLASNGIPLPGGVSGTPGTPRTSKTGSHATQPQNNPINQLKSPMLKTVTSPSAAIDLDFNIDTSQIGGCNDLTAEIDLSDENLGVTPLQDSHEDTPMFCTPRTNSRIVRIISKQSNV